MVEKSNNTKMFWVKEIIWKIFEEGMIVNLPL